MLLILRFYTKIQALKVSEFVPSCANEYAKEKEKNMTIFTKNHEEVLATKSDYLLHTILV